MGKSFVFVYTVELYYCVQFNVNYFITRDDVTCTWYIPDMNDYLSLKYHLLTVCLPGCSKNQLTMLQHPVVLHCYNSYKAARFWQLFYRFIENIPFCSSYICIS